MGSGGSASRQIYKGRLIDLRLEEAVLPNGATIELEIIHHPGAAAVVALDVDGSVALVHQYRHAAGGFIWEVPAGKLDGEDPLVCAARELREEAGLVCGRLTHLGSILTTPGFTNERIHLFLARDLTVVPQQLEDDEVLTVSRVLLAEALEMIRRGEIEDAKSIAALYLAHEHVKRET
jgi:ADP-ribose pyrophosphatase